MIPEAEKNRKIHELRQDVIDQIAAGEIVERPASIVKELIENALDAGSDDISVFLTDGGIGSLKLGDNGSGMSRDDLLLSIKRHATSKIEAIEDLNDLASFGFRGEALASISAVARMRITTKTRNDLVGYSLTVEGGLPQPIEQVAAPNGTEILVEDLFYNLPARRKFLKSTSAEYAQIHDTLIRMIIPVVGTAFKVIKDGRQVISVPAFETMFQRILRLFSGIKPEDLLEFDSSDGEGIRVFGYCSTPSYSRTQAKYLILYVNGRLVKDRRIFHAVEEAYRHFLMKGRYPFCVLFLSLPADLLDINVHPQKSEVRFLDPNRIYRLVHHAISERIYGWSEGGPRRPDRNDDLEEKDQVADRADHSAGGKPDRLISFPVERMSETRSNGYRREDVIRGEDQPASTSLFEKSETPSKDQDNQFYTRLSVIGQFAKSYLLAEGERTLYLIDQHAAYERLTFERLKKCYYDGDVVSQDLAFPIEVSFPSDLSPGFEIAQKELLKIGFAIERFSPVSLLIRSVPIILLAEDVGTIVSDTIEELQNQGSRSGVSGIIDDILISVSCHTSIRANQRLGREEIQRLFAELDRLDYPHHCPHGRPIYRTFGIDEIERLFKRK